MKYLALTTAIAFAATANASEVCDTVHVADFGAKPYTYTNSVECVQRAIDSVRFHNGKKVVLKFEPGRYDIWPEGAARHEYFITNTSSEEECASKVKTIGLLFDGLENVEVDAEGTTLMMHGKITPIAIDGCKNVTLHGFTLDFERPGGSELTYTDVRPGSVTVSVNRDARYDIANNRLQLIGEGWRSNSVHCIKYNPTLDQCSYSGDWYVLANSDVTELADHKLQFATPADFAPEAGTTLTLRDIIRDQVGMFIYQSENVSLCDVHVRYMHGLGIVSQYTRNITMHKVDCTPREGRLLASSADFMHFSGCSGHISIDSCKFVGAQDDGINVHGTNLRGVSRIDDRTLELRFMHPQSYGYQAFWEGDTVAFVQAATMLRKETAVVTAVERLTDRTVRVSFNRNIPSDFEIGHDCVENLTCTPSVEVRNCYFNRTSTRGILMTTPRKVVIADNTFEHTGMCGVLIEADAEGWYESGPVRDVTITRNRFIGCGYNGGPHNATIAINPSNKVIDAKKPVHSGIRITDNYFDTEGRPVLYAKSTRNLTFIGNTIKEMPATPYITEGCSAVRIQK
jgi:hypothetical protein